MKTKTSQKLDSPGCRDAAAGSDAEWTDCNSGLPDADSTVMIHHPDEDEPVWLGYLDGDIWRRIDGVRCAVSHWREFPVPPSCGRQNT